MCTKVDECVVTDWYTTGYCRTHYNRWKKHGNPHTVLKANFKGDDARYLAIHARLRNTYGDAHRHLCIQCLQPASEWAYLHTSELPKYDFVGNSKVPYSTNLDDYGPMCGSCHTKQDMAL